MRRKLSRGFTLIELLVVLAIIGILATIAIVNFISATTKAKQKSTMAALRSIGLAWEARATDVRAYNSAGYSYSGVDIPAAAVSSLLVPTYMRNVPRVDGWGRPLQFMMDEAAGANGNGATYYIIRSAGKDGSFDTSTPDGGTNNSNADIVFSNGAFVVYPEGVQVQ
jgi:type II secretion system protein G